MKPIAFRIARISLAATFLPFCAAAAGLDDHHLNYLPRTDEEAARVAHVTAPPTDFSKPQTYEAASAGAATVPVRLNQAAFSQPSATISPEGKLTFKLGHAFFQKLWVSSPASTKASDGLGPLYNARSCQRCHLNDGRGHPPEGPEDSRVSMVLRLSVPSAAEDTGHEIADYIATRPDPTYGAQLQDLALPGHAAEAKLNVTYEEIEIPMSGGETAILRRPTYEATNLGYGPLHDTVMLSPRVAPQMIGLGLLEAIPATDILARVDEIDADGDGISGRANIVWSLEYDRPMLGRFGQKAAAPTVRQQSAAAFASDIGISTELFPAPEGDCTAAQPKCRDARHGDKDVRVHEVDAVGLDLITFYAQNLAVPARRDVGDREVLRGKEVFHATGCANCHQPSYVTHRLADQPEQSFQLIWPYTDLLIHDMGDGLADGRPEARATGREWRTPPLWGIGLTGRVSGHTYFLHDGRARSLLEAVLWHGGEAEKMKDAVISMPKADRAALIRFLESL